jgi:transposase-like protein
MKERFTIKQFHERYPDDDACLQELFEDRYGHLEICPHCQKPAKFYRVKNRKCYKCAFCAFELHPLADTIFHKSSISLKNWFFAIYLFANSKNGVSAKELERHLGVTYKCAWRMAKQIRLLFQNQDRDGQLLDDVVEADETYVGGKRRGKRGRGAEGKTPIIGVVERDGEVRAKVVDNTRSMTIEPFIAQHVEHGTQLMTDEYRAYNRVSLLGYKHQRINHSSGQYVVGDVHTNTIEGFWSQLKRSICGTYHAISPKYLQHYLNEFAYRYNLRHQQEHLFHGMVLTASRLV